MAEDSTLASRLPSSLRIRQPTRSRFFLFLSGILSLAQTLGLAGSEALYLAELGTAQLPLTFVMASGLTVFGCIAYASLVGRLDNGPFFLALLLASSIGLCGLALLLRLGAPGVLHGLFCAAYLTQAVLINLHFWTFAADYFDTMQSKRLFPRFAVAASVGGVLGGAIAALVSRYGSAEALILAWALALVAAAYLVWAHRHDRQRWRSLGAEEMDESSVEGIRAALRFLTRSSMARWLVVSVAGMVLSLILLQYLYMEVFSREFGSAEALATFFGVYLAASNAVEILLGKVLTPWLLRRFGVATANLVHPVLTCASLLLIAFDPRLYSAILARANRELLENALASPVRQLSYNALPFRFRGRMRAFLEGVVLFGSMGLAGLALWGIGTDLPLEWLAAFGLSAGLLYAGANLLVKREYVRSLVSELRRGRLDLDELESGLGHADLERLASQWEKLLGEDRNYPTRSVLQLAHPLAERGFDDLVARIALHPQPRVRIACTEALAESAPRHLGELLPRLLTDPDTDVRLAASKAVPSLEDRSPELLRTLEKGLGDEDVAVRAEVALHLGDAGLDVLRELVAAPEPRAAVAALRCLPAPLAPLAHERIADPAAQVRAAAIDCIDRLGEAAPLTLEERLTTLGDPDPLVRAAAAQALPRDHDPDLVTALAHALNDEARSVRTAAADALARLGDIGVVAAAPMLASPHVGTVHGALRAISMAKSSLGPSVLWDAYRERVEGAWVHRAGMNLLAREGSVAGRFLHMALDNAYRRDVWLAFRVLLYQEDAVVVRSVRRALRSGSPREHADALDVLSTLGPSETSGRFALLLEATMLDRAWLLQDESIALPRTIDQILERSRGSQDGWLHLAAEALLQERDTPDPTRAAGPAPDSDEVSTMETLLALRNVPFFAGLALDRLEAIRRLMGEAQYLAGEEVVREREPGDRLFVLLEGEVRYYKSYGTPNQRLLAIETPVTCFGEIAIFDGAGRAATVIASKDSLLLTLGAEPFKELVLQAPDVSFDIFRVLTSRIRTAEQRLEQDGGRVIPPPRSEEYGAAVQDPEDRE